MTYNTTHAMIFDIAIYTVSLIMIRYWMDEHHSAHRPAGDHVSINVIFIPIISGMTVIVSPDRTCTLVPGCATV